MQYSKPEIRRAGPALAVVQEPLNKAIPQVRDALQEQGSINAYAADE